MGLNASLTVVARTEHRKYPKTNPAGIAEFELWKDWAPLDEALQTLPAPLPLALRGNRPACEAFEDDWEAYDAFVSPAFAVRISAALETLTENDLIAALKSVGWAKRKSEHPEHLATFETLKAAYREAVRRDAYLRIFIS